MDQRINTLARELMQRHPRKGALAYVDLQIARVLLESHDREQTFGFIPVSHHLWLPEWRRQVERRGKDAFIPLLFVWFRDGDWETPPDPEPMPITRCNACLGGGWRDLDGVVACECVAGQWRAQQVGLERFWKRRSRDES